ncbi:MAG: GAF domain-containing protein [Rhodospirillales bacterium]|jgi:GAF domain-containing protein|nr:GAF domain-containing protein [Rhodospirillales bacterium]
MQRTINILDEVKSHDVAPEKIYQAVCMDVAEQTGANRVSIWHLEDDDSCIRCSAFYHVSANSFTSGEVLFAKDLPKYFNTILSEKSIVAPDVFIHPATAELVDIYFKKHGIYSMLDFIIYSDFKPIGVICCENAGEHRDWKPEDVSYLLKLSTVISFYFK